jgi:dimethylargininase
VDRRDPCSQFRPWRLVDAGFPMTAVDVPELQKANGAMTCCRLAFRAQE